MPQQPIASVENNFTQGLKTEYTGMNFPENAATDTDNCVFTLVGNVKRRMGIDYELNHVPAGIDVSGKASSSFTWTNAGGDGNTRVIVVQVGVTLHFYRASTVTIASPLSAQKLASTIDMTTFVPPGGTSPTTAECQFAAGNGYLFVFNPNCDPFYCTYAAGTITATRVVMKTRDFKGIEELGVDNTLRPNTLTDPHKYNLFNQGWTDRPWSATSSTSNTIGSGALPASRTFTVAAGLSILAGDVFNANGYLHVDGTTVLLNMSGTVTSYAGTTLVLNVTFWTTIYGSQTISDWTIFNAVSGKITTWNTTVGGYPSNSDVWWTFKNTSNVFAPVTTLSNVSLNAGPAPKGYFILEAFNQDRGGVSGISTIAAITTTARPKTGAWFQGRVWYSGVDATGDFTESIYFSQIIERTDQFGKCYQTNDPTSENRFDLLPIDGGVIRIQGCGSIFKLFPLQNGMLVFAANGIWYITGSQGIGFAANDFTVMPISEIRSISGTSFVNVLGYPMFWNEEGIYHVVPAQQGQQAGGQYERLSGLTVTNMALGTILSFYRNIPLTSKQFVRGDYDPINYVVQWTFKSTEAADVTSRYQFDRILNYNTANKAFYPWTIGDSGIGGSSKILGVRYVVAPGGSTSPEPILKYITSFTSSATAQVTLSEERDDTNWKDWNSASLNAPATGPVNYSSFFVTGYKLHGQAQKRFQSNYIYVYSNNYVNMSYKIQGVWDYAISGNSGKFSNLELAQIGESTANFSVAHRRHRVRGRGLVLQFKVLSKDGTPFDIIGWSVDERLNQSV